MDIFSLAIIGIFAVILGVIGWVIFRRKTPCEKAYDILNDIPESKWIIGMLKEMPSGKCCALGHLMMNEIGRIDVEDSKASLYNDILFKKVNAISLADANDGHFAYPQPTPKQRALAWLSDAINLGY